MAAQGTGLWRWAKRVVDMAEEQMVSGERRKSIFTHLPQVPEALAIRRLRGTLLLMVFVLLFHTASESAPAEIVLGDFESAVEEWTTNDGVRSYPNDLEHARVRIFPSSDTPSAGGEYSLYILFSRSSDTWASVSVPLDGRGVAQEEGATLEFDLKGDGSPRAVRLGFRTSRGPGDDRSFETTVSLSNRAWKHLSIPLREFVAGDRALPDEGLEYVWLFQFVMRGSWTDTYFRIDNVRIVGAPPEVSPSPPPVPPSLPPEETPIPPSETVPAAPTPPPPLQYTVQADFTRKLLDFRLVIAANVLPEDVERLSDAKLSAKIRELNAPILRTVFRLPEIDAGPDAMAPLNRTVEAIRRLGSSALVCLDVPIGPRTSESSLVQWASLLVKHFNRDRGTPVAYWELFNEPLFAPSDLPQAIRLINSVAAKMKSIDPQVRVGGFGLSFADEAQLWALMNGARDTLSFCSWHFYGAHSLSVSDEPRVRDGLDPAQVAIWEQNVRLGIMTPEEFRQRVYEPVGPMMTAANTGIPVDTPNPIGPRRADELLRAAGLSRGLLFVTECNSNAVQSDGQPMDPRLMQSFNAAWLVSYAMAAGPFVDVIFTWRLLGEGWGMFDPQGKPGPLYWAAWLLNHYAPRGASVFASEHSAPGIRAMAVGTDTFRAIFLVNQKNQRAAVSLSAAGLRRPFHLTVKRLDPAGWSLVEEEASPPAPRPSAPAPERRSGSLARAELGTIALEPYGVSVVVIPTGA